MLTFKVKYFNDLGDLLEGNEYEIKDSGWFKIINFGKTTWLSPSAVKKIDVEVKQ